ncbi:hypothetical protein B0J15DRAFT_501848 [Fusarium solani]|uniref:Zn(2)-C6 fungal-type domain-containing protein n=1 Tax=Fusarium solani TaxID=169388 RepID=A0A9P9GRP6_FUSSL|nr:uncharacterized protein B0J15DRAFT_501848 [Fusarium solani]KAH7243084.1 hypothetical protein B0J15DRAFT_501848 [Fusarium solani]
MTRVKPGQRQRTRAPKVLRKVKCDEARPACKRCTSTGRKCDGYRADSSNCVTLPASVGSIYALTPQARSLQFFTEKTLAGLQTFFPDDLWNTKILQVAQSTECIRNAIIALASFHEQYLKLTSSQQPGSKFGLGHYNLAIRQSISSSNEVSSPPHIPILSCLIFVCIEVLQGKIESAIALFKYGSKIIQQYQSDICSVNQFGNCYLNPQLRSDAVMTLQLAKALFKRIAVQIYMLTGDVDSELVIAFKNTFGGTYPLHDMPFRCLAEAREALLDIIVEQASPGLKGQDAEQLMFHSVKIRQWCSLFDTLIAKDYSGEKPLSDVERRAIALLQVYRQYLEINVAKYAYGQGDPCFWDRFTAEFGNMVNNAAIATGLDGKGSEQTSKSLFHMDIGVSSILFSIIARCRDPTIRRKAIGIMLAHRSQEGVWNSPLAAQGAIKLMELEESRSGKEVKRSQDIPEEARVRTVRLYLESGKRTAKMVYGFDQGSWEWTIPS